MNAIRSAGYAGSTGRYAAPAFSTRQQRDDQLSRAVHQHRHHRLRARPAPGQHPGQPARPRIQLGVRQVPPAQATATASGTRATCAANNSARVSPGTASPGTVCTGAAAVSFQPSSTCARSRRAQHRDAAQRGVRCVLQRRDQVVQAVCTSAQTCAGSAGRDRVRRSGRTRSRCRSTDTFSG